MTWRIERVVSDVEPSQVEELPGDLRWSLLELAEREKAVGISGGGRILYEDEAIVVDLYATRWFNSVRFAAYRPSTRRDYALDLRLFARHLKSTPLVAATSEHLDAYERLRVHTRHSPGHVSRQRWIRGHAAIKSFYRWAGGRGRAPKVEGFLTAADRDSDVWATVSVKRGRTYRAKWLTPQAIELYLATGIQGLKPGGLEPDVSRGRQFERNAAIFNLLAGSGLRLQEGMSLLTVEIPARSALGSFIWADVQDGVTKSGLGRGFLLQAKTRDEIYAYMASGRRAAIRRAQKAHRYDKSRYFIVSELNVLQDTICYWSEAHGSIRLPFHELDPETRRQLFIETANGLEPLALWLGEDGVPLLPHSMENVFRAADRRVKRVTGNDTLRCRPHMLRHSFAIFMLLALMGAEGPGDVREWDRQRTLNLRKNPWRMVQGLLGHASVELTEAIYLEPIIDIDFRDLLSPAPAGLRDWMTDIFDLLEQSRLVIGASSA